MVAAAGSRPQFKPTLGKELFGQIEDQIAFDDANRAHQGSAFQDGW